MMILTDPLGGSTSTASAEKRPAASRRPTTNQTPTNFDWLNPPIVQAMLTGNTLSNCEQVQQMVEACQRSNSDDMICEAAANAYALCQNNNNGYVMAHATHETD